MKTLLRLGALAAAVFASAGAMTGCSTTVDAGVQTVPARTGSVTLHWSVDGSFHPAACDAFAAFDARIDVYDVNGQPIVTRFVDCRAFSDRIDLYAGRYSARIQMVDQGKQPRSTSLPVSTFTIIADSDLSIDTDFPRTSFY